MAAVPMIDTDIVSLWTTTTTTTATIPTPTTTTTPTTTRTTTTTAAATAGLPPWLTSSNTVDAISNTIAAYDNNNYNTIAYDYNINNYTNGTDDNKAGPLITLAVPLLMFGAGVLGNLLALLLLWRSRKENARSVFYFLVAALAVTDLLGTVTTSPFTIYVYSNGRQWVGGAALCGYFSFMMVWASTATVLTLGSMALERYLAVLHPFGYERHMLPGRVKYVMALIWLFSAAFSCLPLIGLGQNIIQYPGTWCFFDFYSHRVQDQVFSFLYASIGLLVIALTACMNVAVMVVLLRIRRVSKNFGKSSEGRTLNMTSEMQMIFFLAGIIVVFAMCYSPLLIRVMINACTVNKDVRADLMAIRLASLNQILDPWVYLLFRRRLAALMYSACKTVSPLQNWTSSRRGFKSEARFGSPRNSPTIQRRVSTADNCYDVMAVSPLTREVGQDIAAAVLAAKLATAGSATDAQQDEKAEVSLVVNGVCSSGEERTNQSDSEEKEEKGEMEEKGENENENEMEEKKKGTEKKEEGFSLFNGECYDPMVADLFVENESEVRQKLSDVTNVGQEVESGVTDSPSEFTHAVKMDESSITPDPSELKIDMQKKASELSNMDKETEAGVHRKLSELTNAGQVVTRDLKPNPSELNSGVNHRLSELASTGLVGASAHTQPHKRGCNLSVTDSDVLNGSHQSQDEESQDKLCSSKREKDVVTYNDNSARTCMSRNGGRREEYIPKRPHPVVKKTTYCDGHLACLADESRNSSRHTDSDRDTDSSTGTAGDFSHALDNGLGSTKTHSNDTQRIRTHVNGYAGISNGLVAKVTDSATETKESSSSPPRPVGPIICRHGNHGVVKAGTDQCDSESGTGEVQPLLRKVLHAECSQCERNKGDVFV